MKTVILLGVLLAAGCSHRLKAAMVNVEDFSVQGGVSAYRVRDEFETFVPLTKEAYLENVEGPVYFAGRDPWERIPAIYLCVGENGRVYERDGSLTAMRRNLLGTRPVVVTEYSPSEVVLDFSSNPPVEMRVVELR